MHGRRAMRFGAALAMLAVAAAAPARAAEHQVKLTVGLDHGLYLVGKKQTVYLKVGLEGLALQTRKARPEANVALVIDRSGSMSGPKIAQAREAAIRALDWLGARDIVSVVAYDNSVTVLVPATRLTDKHAVATAIRSLRPGGSTALFGGVSKGAAEVRKFLDRNRVNRIILLSDGLANVGPQSPADLASLGASLVKEGISVTTIGLGLGYNEDLMTQLALKSDGNHAFVQEPKDLLAVFKREFGDVLSVVAQDVVIRVRCRPGVRPVRILGREGTINGQDVTLNLNQVYGKQQKFALIEVEVTGGTAGASRPVAGVEVTYANMATRRPDRLRSSIGATFTESKALAEKSVSRTVMVSVVEAIGILNNRRAVALRDQGKAKEAQKVFNLNRDFLLEKSVALKSGQLKDWAGINARAGRNVVMKGKIWIAERKSQKEEQSRRMRQTYTAPKGASKTK